MNEYMNVKTMVTMTARHALTQNAHDHRKRRNGLQPLREGAVFRGSQQATDTASRMGPGIMTLKYSMKRRPKLLGRSTRHTKLKRWPRLFEWW